MSLVVDASVAIAWCFGDEQTPALMALLDRVGEDGAEAPSPWPLEVAKTLVLAKRRKHAGAEAVEDLLGFPRDLPVRLDASTATQAWDATALLAERHRLRVYDAVHLELALRCGLSVAMLDKTRQRRPLGRGAGVGGWLAASTA